MDLEEEEENDWNLSPEELDSLERRALQQIAERKRKSPSTSISSPPSNHSVAAAIAYTSGTCPDPILVDRGTQPSLSSQLPRPTTHPSHPSGFPPKPDLDSCPTHYQVNPIRIKPSFALFVKLFQLTLMIFPSLASLRASY